MLAVGVMLALRVMLTRAGTCCGGATSLRCRPDGTGDRAAPDGERLGTDGRRPWCGRWGQRDDSTGVEAVKRGPCRSGAVLGPGSRHQALGLHELDICSDQGGRRAVRLARRGAKGAASYRDLIPPQARCWGRPLSARTIPLRPEPGAPWHALAPASEHRTSHTEFKGANPVVAWAAGATNPRCGDGPRADPGA